jgi:hypothetical protein
VTALDDAGASVALLTTTPAQAASAVSVAQANGLGMSFVGSNPTTFSPSLLTGPTADALQASYEVAQSVAPYVSDADGLATVRDTFDAEFAGETPTSCVFYGYAQAEVMAQILETGCEERSADPRRSARSLREHRRGRHERLVGPLDFSEPGQPLAREVVFLKPDASVDGGLSEVEGLIASPLATEFERGA